MPAYAKAARSLGTSAEFETLVLKRISRRIMQFASTLLYTYSDIHRRKADHAAARLQVHIIRRRGPRWGVAGFRGARLQCQPEHLRRDAAARARCGAQAQLRAQFDRQQPHDQAHQYRRTDPRQPWNPVLRARAASVQPAIASPGATGPDVYGRPRGRERRGDPA